MNPKMSQRWARWRPALLPALALACLATTGLSTWAADGDGRGGRDERNGRAESADRSGHRGDRRGDWRAVERRDPVGPRQAWPDGRRARPADPRAIAHRGPAPRAPRVGWAVAHLPPATSRVAWRNGPYHYHAGTWYRPARQGYVVVRPPRGIRVHRLPDFAATVLLGGLIYWVVNDVYYRELPRAQGYEVVDTPVGGGRPAEPATTQQVFVYPNRGQSATVQAADEYDCHRWAVRQTGFDPTAVVGGSGGSSAGLPADYQRARGACLDARGYTVR